MARTNAIQTNATADASPDSAPSLRQKAKAMFRQAILDAAEQVFASQGIRNARIQDIAKLAGMSVGTVYNHFAQKEDIILALISDQEGQFRAAFEPKPEDPTDFEGAWRTRNRRVMQLVCEHRQFFAFALYEGIFESDLVRADSVFSARGDGVRMQFNSLVEDLLEQGMREGLVERQDPVRLKHFYAGAIRSVLMATVKNPDLDPVQEGQFAVELFLRAVRPRDKKGP
jgi:AcrR family transcriptional regulator